MVDTVMIGALGERDIAASGLANQLFFLFVLILFGINSGSGIFIAQYFGKKDIKNIHRVQGIGLITSCSIALIFTLGAVLFPKSILSAFSKDSMVVIQGSKYLRIVGLSYVINAISLSYAFALRSTRQAKIPMFISIIALLTNTILNYLLIFGKFGFPFLGIEGAAIATLIARIVEFLCILGYVYSTKNILAAPLKQLFDLSKEFIANFFKITIPVILNEGFWALGMTMYSMAYARISTEAIATVQISNTVQNIFMVMNMGISNACAVMIGNKIGEGKQHRAIEYSKKFSYIVPILGAVMGLLLIIASPLILKAFSVRAETYSDAIKVLRIIGIIMPIKAFNALLVVGILRSGGDTKFSLFLETGTVWLVGVPLAFLGALLLKWPVYMVVSLVMLEEVVKVFIGIWRVKSKKWIRSVVQ